MPNNPLKMLNSYVLIGPTRNLVIDTGFNRPECLAAMSEGLNSLKLDMSRTDFFVTHLHADHTGLLAALKTPTSRLYASATDAKAISALCSRQPDDPWYNELEAFACSNGFSAAEAEEAVRRHPGLRLGPEGPLEFIPLADGDQLEVGCYRFTCLATPGHTAGHMCLYEPERRLLLSGDHILGDITPNISRMGSATTNPLAEYLASLARVAELEVDLVLPGHRRLVTNCRERIGQLIDHHGRRADEALAAVCAEPLTAYQVAGRMTWDLTFKSWAEFPPPQKWFAVGEALAHLLYLEGLGRVTSSRHDGKILYKQQKE